MNRAILTREKVVRLVRLLTEEKGVRVTQRGTQAFVEYNPDGSPRRVNIPYIPDDATEEFLSAIEGFLDHEVAHVLFTDYKALAKAKKSGVARLHNIIEDAYIERMMAKTFAGSALNLSNVGGFFLKTYTDKMIKEDSDNMEGYLMVPAIRALSGQVVYQDYMKDKWHLIKETVDRFRSYAEENLPKIQNSFEGVEAALKIKELLELPPEDDGDGDGDEGESGSGKKDTGKGKKGESKSSEDGEDDDAGESGPEGEPGEEDDSGGEDGSSGDGEDDADEDDGEDEERPDMDISEDIDEKDEKHKPEHKSGLGEESEDKDDGEGETGPKEPKSSKKSSPSATPKGGAKKGSTSYDETFKESSADYDKALSDILSKMSREESKKSEYLIYTRDLDVIEPMEVGRHGSWDDGMLKEMQDQVDHMLGPLQKDLERAVAAKSATVWAAGLRSGRLHAAALARLTALGDERAFRRKHVSESKDVAVSLVVDCSGSMRGGKILTAAQAAYGLSSVLDRMKINHEVLGFTTQKPLPAEMGEEERRTGVRYARYQNLYIPIFKSYAERLGTEAKKRFAALPHVHWLCENVDGESVQIAATRLLQRTEKRKIMIVLSDGQPACPSGNHAALHSHLKKVVHDVERQGVDVLGIGIQSEAPKRYYSKNVVLNSISELPTTVIREIKRLLMQ